MDIKGLFKGIAVVIDDEINDASANINDIVRQIESEKIPVLKYTALPDDDFVVHCHNLSFLLLDWNLIKINATDEKFGEIIKIPTALKDYGESKNIEFIKKLTEKCFCPIFIFTNEDISYIKSLLFANGEAEKPSNLFIRSKNDLKPEGNLFSKISEWLWGNPSVYVLKEWEKGYQECKTRLFSDFYKINPAWPLIMWKTFAADGANKSLEMGELIARNLHSRMTPFDFKDEVLQTEQSSITSKEELRKVLEGERFLNISSLHENDIGTGDVFKEEYQENGQNKFRYYLNIRAQCDLLRSGNADKLELYCLKGRIVDENGFNSIDDYPIVEGQFIEKVNNSIVPFLDGGLIIEFMFREIKIKKWGELKSKRIGRLLPPYITKIQQRYALYQQRQGIPRIPDEAIFGNDG